MKRVFYSEYESPVGKLTMAESDNVLVGLWIENQKYFAKNVQLPMEKKDDVDIFDKTKIWLDRYFRGEKPEIDEIKINPQGSEFQETIWKLLLGIPYGQTVTYGYLAKKYAIIMGRKSMSAQAVGGAVGHNPISIIVPCHRVIGAAGGLTGYAGGIEIKKALLKLEGVL